MSLRGGTMTNVVVLTRRVLTPLPYRKIGPSVCVSSHRQFLAAWVAGVVHAPRNPFTSDSRTAPGKVSGAHWRCFENLDTNDTSTVSSFGCLHLIIKHGTL